MGRKKATPADSARSETAQSSAVQADEITLNPPELFAPASSPIDVLDFPFGVVAQVTFAEMPGDEALLNEINAAPGAAPFPVQIIFGGESNFTVDAAFLAVRQGKDIELTWTLIRGGVPVAESESLWLRVNRMADGDPRLPTPIITAVTDGVTLDLGTFVGDAFAWTDPWTGIAPGQRLWTTCDSFNTSGAPVSLPIHQGVAIELNQPGWVARAFLDSLADGWPFSVRAAVNFAGTPDEATAVTLPVRTYTVKAHVRLLTIWNFDDNTFQGWTAQGPYQGGDLHVAGGVVHASTNSSANFSGLVMTIVVYLVAGRTYNFSFQVAARGAGSSGTILQLTINNAAIGASVDTQNQVGVWKTGFGVFTATATGGVTLGLWNHVASAAGNDFMIDNIWVQEA
jgi:hypothetical protein